MPHPGNSSPRFSQYRGASQPCSWTLDQLAGAADVSRRMLVNVEQGDIATGAPANVTITLDVRPDFELPDYENLPTEITTTDATKAITKPMAISTAVFAESTAAFDTASAVPLNAAMSSAIAIRPNQM